MKVPCSCVSEEKTLALFERKESSRNPKHWTSSNLWLFLLNGHAQDEIAARALHIIKGMAVVA